MILFSNFRLSIWVVQKRIYFTSGRNTVSRKGSIGCILLIQPKMLKHFSLYKALSNTNKIILSITSSTFLSGDLLKFAKFQAFRHVFQTVRPFQTFLFYEHEIWQFGSFWVDFRSFLVGQRLLLVDFGSLWVGLD